MKKYVIITLRLALNYGGIMQAYALQEFARSIGYEIKTSYPDRPKLKIYLAMRLKRLLLLTLGRGVFVSLEEEEAMLGRNTQEFVRKNISTLKWRQTVNPEGSIDGYIVGSDQVWRAAYVNIDDYLLKFTGNSKLRRISYAASFGRSDLSEYSADLLSRSRTLASKFDAISVREDSGLSLVQQNWQMPAEQHLDPTLLIEAAHYRKLVSDSDDGPRVPTGGLFAYVLDREGGKGLIIEKAARSLDLVDFEIMPQKAASRKVFMANPEHYRLPPVTQWLRSFMEADFVVTDSFHGTAFSIIFNKPFIAIGNKGRGMARFTSILKVFGLEDRLVSDVSEVTEELLRNEIDWERVNATIEIERNRSFEYLKKHLG